MVTESAAVEHYLATLKEESKTVGKLILDRAKDFEFALFDAENIVKEKPIYTTQSLPRPAQRVLKSLYDDAAKYPKDAASVAEFIDGRLLPTIGFALSANRRAVDFIAGATERGRCAYAENYFRNCKVQIQTLCSSGQERIEVYHTPEHVPLLIVKDFEEPTALTLVDFLAVPDGAIVDIDHTMGCQETETGRYELEEFTFVTYEVKAPLSMRPLRLSAWAYETELDRALFAIDSTNGKPNYDVNRAELVTGFNIGHFRQAAARLMQLCGIEPAVIPD